MVAAVGAVLLIVSLFLDWYEVDLEGFTVFEFLDLSARGHGARDDRVAGRRCCRRLVMARRAVAGLSRSPWLCSRSSCVVSQILNDPPAVAGAASARRPEIGIWRALGGGRPAR